MRYLFFLAYIIPIFLDAQKNEGSGIAPGLSAVLAEETGFNIRLHYFPSHKMCFGVETNFFPKTEMDLKNDMEITFNGHFIFELGEHWGIYPLVGAGWKKTKEDSGWRALTGGGFHGKYGIFQPYIEYIYNTGFKSEGAFIIGTFLTLEFKKE
ncbi:MAG: hypothetical protein ACJA08_002924 [Cyclobacteriaceae bacterium]|jgi:hypothetical protein